MFLIAISKDALLDLLYCQYTLEGLAENETFSDVIKELTNILDERFGVKRIEDICKN